MIELLAVIIILGILMVISIPSVTSYINNSRKSAYVDNESKSPYGDFVDGETYVVVTYTGSGFNYYWVSKDSTGQGVNTITSLYNLDEDDIVSDIKVGDIKTNIPVGNRTKVQEIDAECLLESEMRDADIANAIPEERENYKENGELSGKSGNITPTNINTSTILATAQASNQLNQIPGTNIYIFKGGNPANYVKFNGEDWRIIGIYNGQMKIIRVNSNRQPTAPNGFTSVQWNTLSSNQEWANSSLKESLNTTYYNTLSDTAKSMIDDDGVWNVGAVSYSATALQSYTSSKTTWNGKVGLMASYEFLYATGGNDECLSTMGIDYYEKCGTATNNWMKPSFYSWTMTPYSGSSDLVLLVNSIGSNGGMSSGNLDNFFAAVPVVYIKSSVSITGGNGTNLENAYILHYEES